MENMKKTDNFLKAIKKFANVQKSAMQSEVKQLKTERLRDAEDRAKADSERLIANRLEQKRNEQTSLIAKKTQDGQRELFLERAAMTEEIFKAAEEKLAAYTATDAYTERLRQSAEKISAAFEGRPCVLYVREQDQSHAGLLKDACAGCEVQTDKSIKIGGVKGYCEPLSVIADETLDSKLALQREWFVENAELKVL